MPATDLKARAFAILGNAKRVASDLPGAREAINEAWRLNDEGAGDPLDKAQILSLDASYARTMGEFETAEAILERALVLYLTVGDAHLQGLTHVVVVTWTGRFLTRAAADPLEVRLGPPVAAPRAADRDRARHAAALCRGLSSPDRARAGALAQG